MDCDQEVRSKFFEPIAVERRQQYVRQFRDAGFENPDDRIWEKSMTEKRPYWIATDRRVGEVVQSYARSRFFDFEYMPVLVNDRTNFFELLLQVNAKTSEFKGVLLWISVTPGSKIDGLDAHLFIDSICELMSQGKLVLVIEERSATSFDEVPSHFIQPAA